jgi:hypothetical protein
MTNRYRTLPLNVLRSELLRLRHIRRSWLHQPTCDPPPGNGWIVGARAHVRPLRWWIRAVLRELRRRAQLTAARERSRPAGPRTITACRPANDHGLQVRS